MAGKAAADTGK
jgi:hypothetical protein